MLKKSFVRFGSAAIILVVASCTFLFFIAAGNTQGTSQDRILRQIDSAQMAAVKGTAHPMARPQFDQGRLSPERQLSDLRLTFHLSPAQQSDLQELLRQQQDPSSPNYHRWLTPEQYAARFGMSQNDLTKVTAWLQSQGLAIQGVSRSKNAISFSGSVGQIEYALKTELHKYSINGKEHFANSTSISLPAAFASEVLGVSGLNNFYPKPRIRKLAPKFTSNVSGNHFVIPNDFATIYDVPAGFDGSGVTIAVIGQTEISTSDIDEFRSASGLPARTSSNFIQTLVPGTGAATTCTGDETESDLDLEWSEGVAQNATINFVYAGLGASGSTCDNRTTNAFDALQYAVDSNVAPIISISYGNCEANLGASFILTMQQWAQQANAQGQTINGPAGDSGAADCDTGNSATEGLAVDVPAAIPEVTGVGGSEFMGDATATISGSCASSTPYWNGSCAPTSPTGTALSYIPEQAWNDTTASLAQSTGLDGTGGGASTIFGKPSWQAGTGVPSDGSRDVPDLALNASNFHDPYLLCSQDVYTGETPEPTTCTSGFRDSTGGLAAVGGTSAGPPTFSGIVALVSQATHSTGLGNVNPMLYALSASTPAAFHDITSGNNNVPCSSGTPNCPSGTTSIGFSAGTGYDQVTGLGSLDVTQLVNAWVAATPAGDFALDGLISASPAAGTSGTSQITVSSLDGFTGTVNLTCSSGSSAVSCSLNPTSVSLTNSAPTATASLNLSTSADLRLPKGSHPRSLWWEAPGGVFAIAILGGIPSRRRWYGIFMMVLLAIGLTAMGCGGGSSSPSTTPVQQTQSPQSYIVTVTGTGTNSSGTALSHSTTLSFTVQ